MNKRVVRLVASFALSIFSGIAMAGTGSVVMTNIVTITGACTIIATGFVANYDPVVANNAVALDTTASVTTTCTLGSVPVVTLGQGANAGSGSTDAAPARRLLSITPGIFLNYGLFTDANRATTWGNTAATAPLGVISTGLPASMMVYVRIPADQTSAKASTYTDTVLATVTF